MDFKIKSNVRAKCVQYSVVNALFLISVSCGALITGFTKSTCPYKTNVIHLLLCLHVYKIFTILVQFTQPLNIYLSTCIRCLQLTFLRCAHFNASAQHLRTIVYLCFSLFVQMLHFLINQSVLNFLFCTNFLVVNNIVFPQINHKFTFVYILHCTVFGSI